MRERDTRYKPGQSGNPTGRPKGARKKATVAVETLLEGEAETITRRCIDLALEGDHTALRLCLSRIFPLSGKKTDYRTGSTRSAGLPGLPEGNRNGAGGRWLGSDHTIGRTGRGVVAGDASADF